MNLFDFLTNMYTLSTQSFTGFVVVTFFTLLNGILLIAMINAISNIRLLGRKESKKEEILKINNMQENNEKATSVYDMLVQAYEKHKNKGNDKSDS